MEDDEEEVDNRKKWKEKLLVIEEMRNGLLPEHQKTQKRSQNMQSIQDKEGHLLKEAGACDEDNAKIREEINEREAHHLELANKSDNNRMAAEDLEE